MSTKFIPSSFAFRFYALLITVLLLLTDICVASAAQLADYKVKIILDDTHRDGSIDRKLHLQISNEKLKSDVELTCNHRTLGQGGWIIRFSNISVLGQSQEDRVQVFAQVVADVALIADDLITKKYSTNHVDAIELTEKGMPSFLIQSIYEMLAIQMKQNNAKSQAAYDRELKRMLQVAFDKNENLQQISKQLEKRGFSNVHAKPQELISVRPEFVGITWRKISKESAAGLERGSATVVFDNLSL